MTNTLIAVPGGWELVLIVLVILLLFGAKKLPELARGSGRALRIFKAETKGLTDDDDDDPDVSSGQKSPEQKELEARREQQSDPIVREQRDGTTG
jgi:sec-independent protein translocase protein TatA